VGVFEQEQRRLPPPAPYHRGGVTPTGQERSHRAARRVGFVCCRRRALFVPPACWCPPSRRSRASHRGSQWRQRRTTTTLVLLAAPIAHDQRHLDNERLPDRRSCWRLVGWVMPWRCGLKNLARGCDPRSTLSFSTRGCRRRHGMAATADLAETASRCHLERTPYPRGAGD